MITIQQLQEDIKHAQRRIAAHKMDLSSNNSEIRNAAKVFIEHHTKEREVAFLALRQLRGENVRLPAPKYSMVERAMILEHITKIKDARTCDMLLQLWNWFVEGGYNVLDPITDAPGTDASGKERSGLLQSEGAQLAAQIRAGAGVPFDNGSR